MKQPSYPRHIQDTVNNIRRKRPLAVVTVSCVEKRNKEGEVIRYDYKVETD